MSPSNHGDCWALQDMVVVLAVRVISATEWTLCESQEGGQSSQSSEMPRDERGVVASPLLPSEGWGGTAGSRSCPFLTLPFASLLVPILGSLAKPLTALG